MRLIVLQTPLLFLQLQPASALPAWLHLDWPWPAQTFLQPIPDTNHHCSPVDIYSNRPAESNAVQTPKSGFEFPHRPGTPSRGFVAFGDSYSAGIGTGVNGSEQDCRVGSHAYPALIRNDITAIHDLENATFQHLSCTGSTIEDVLAGGEHSQIDLFNTTDSADFALLSIGGNDLGFFDIMNSCIFRFYSFYSGTCEAALQRSEKQIADPAFDQHLRLLIMEILDRVQWEKRPWFTITVTGYARFFNAETKACDDYSLGMWWRGPKLQQELRRKMNHMVVNVNRRIEQAIDTINAAFTEPRVLFVNYDDDFEGHRFCEPTVVEPDYMRNETWFFLVGGEDNDGSTMPHDTLPPNSALADPEVCLSLAEKSGDQGGRDVCMMAFAARDNANLQTRDGPVVAQNSMWYVPTYYGKTFHPVSSTTYVLAAA